MILSMFNLSESAMTMLIYLSSFGVKFILASKNSPMIVDIFLKPPEYHKDGGRYEGARIQCWFVVRDYFSWPVLRFIL